MGLRAGSSRGVTRLLVLTVALASVSAACGQVFLAPEVQKLIDDWQAAYQAEDYARAIEIGLELVEVTGGVSVYQYNLACVYALHGDKAEAVKWLGKCAEKGFSQAALAETDPDFANIRSEPGFVSALGRIKQNRAVQLKRIEERVAKTKPVIILPPAHDASKPTPLIVALHPFGTTPLWITQRWEETAKHFGAILLAPSALRANATDTGYQWVDPDEADVIVSAAWKHVLRSYAIDRRRVVLTGFSQGASMAHSLGLRHPDVFSGVIPMAGRYTPPAEPPKCESGSTFPKYYIMVGADDNMAHNNRQAAREYEAAGIPVKIKVFEGLGHRFPPNHQAELRQALKYVWGE